MKILMDSDEPEILFHPTNKKIAMSIVAKCYNLGSKKMVKAVGDEDVPLDTIYAIDRKAVREAEKVTFDYLVPDIDTVKPLPYNFEFTL